MDLRAKTTNGTTTTGTTFGALSAGTTSNGGATMGTKKADIKDVLKKSYGAFSKIDVAISMDGKNAIVDNDGQYITYDTVNGQLTASPIGVTVKGMAMPVPTNTIVVGDIIIQDGFQAFVTGTNPIKVVKPTGVGVHKKVINNIFGIQNTVKVINPFSGAGVNPMMLMLLNKKKENSNFGFKEFLMMQGFSGSANSGTGLNNPAMLMALAGDGDMDATTLMMMSGAFGGASATGGAAGGMNPLLMASLMGDGDKKIDPATLMMMGGLGGANAAQGAMNPLLMMSLMGDGDKKLDPVTLMALSGGLGGANATPGAMNPAMLMALAGDGEIDPIIAIAMMGGNLFGAAPVAAPVAAACDCGCDAPKATKTKAPKATNKAAKRK